LVVTKEQKKTIPFQYANDVVTGKLTTGKYIKKAVDRFYKWIDKADEQGYYLDHQSGMHVLLFFEKFLRHTKGKVAGELFVLSPYQQFTFYNIFAWKHKDTGKRRIKTVYEKVARKNGKTAQLSGLGLYGLTFDDEDSPEIYVGATKEAQAKILWSQAYDFVYKSQPLRSIGVVNTQREIRFKKRLGKLMFLGGDSKTQDGLNPSISIIDEYHAHKDDSVREVLESAMGARQNPLLYIITTAGFNTTSVCKQAEDVYKDVLDGNKEDDSTLIMIHDLDDEDDWNDSSNWIKANPNLGVSVNKDYIENEYKKAKNQVSKIPNFKTKHLNMWVDAEEVRVPAEIWDLGKDKVNVHNFIDNGCKAALDLSSTTDLSAFVLVSNADENGIYDILPFVFCPADTIDKRSKDDGVPYRLWSDDKVSNYIINTDDKFINNSPILIKTSGNQIDYSEIQSVVNYIWQVIKPDWIEYDSWQATQLVQNLTELDIEMHPFPQTITHFSYPTKEFESLAYKGKLRHGGNPILKWMLSGCVAIFDPNENIRYSKAKATKRIDGIIATIMALAGVLTEAETNKSQYDGIEGTDKLFG